ncbi:MAG TPA: FliH/SctL family protein [Verrucomicrobiae bacterium]|nr:FliH/SctL family protein [Verrucomicrobiae bacterium]
MSWSETIHFDRPLSNVCLLAEAPLESWEQILRAREEFAYQRGHRDGQAALNRQLIQQRSEIAELQRGILNALQSAVPQVIHESEAALITLALEAARRVVADLPIDVRLVEEVIREALRQAEDTAEILVQVNADDLALLRNNDAALLNGLPDKGPLRFVASSEVTRGGCVIQTRFGVIDAQRETKLQQLAESVCA